VRHGEAYLGAAAPLPRRGRWEDAEDALARHLQVNKSSVEAWYRMALVKERLRDDGGSRAARAEACSLFGQIWPASSAAVSGCGACARAWESDYFNIAVTICGT